MTGAAPKPLSNLPLIGAPLTPSDLSALEKSYISPELAKRAGLKRVSHIEGSRLMGRLNDSANNAGIIFPYQWPGEDGTAYRLRRDKPPQKSSDDGSLKDEFKYVSKAGQPGILYLGPETTREMLFDPKLPIVITEGEKKCLALHRVAEENVVKGKPRYLALGLPGVWNWLSRNEGADDSRSHPIKRLDDVLWEKREVTILFDANAETNTNVAKAQEGLAKELKGRKAKVRIGRVPALPGVNGIDDLLGLEGPNRLLQEILPCAKSWKAATPSSATSDADNADRLIKLFGDDIRFVLDRGIWAFWNGSIWVVGRDAKSLVIQKALETSETVAPSVTHKLKSKAKIEAMVGLAQDINPAIRVEHARFDANPDLLNVANGTVDLRSGELRDPRREDLLSKRSPIEFHPDAQCPRFEKFLNDIFNGNGELILFMKRALGYTLTGHINEHVVFFLHGTGRNGKGTLINIIHHVLGRDYSHAANIASFMKSSDSGQGPNEGLAALCGNRFVSAQEPNENRRYDTALLKSLTGGDKITTHRKYEHQFTFDPTHKLWIATNPPPVIPPDDPAIWARTRLIPFNVSFQGREDHGLFDALKEEAAGILNWLIEGAKEWYQEGLGKCAAVEGATADLRDQNDRVAQFIADRCEMGEDYWVKPKSLYDDYIEWAKENGHRHVLSLPKFLTRLDARGYQKVTVQGTKRRKGLRLRQSESGFPATKKESTLCRPLKMVYGNKPEPIRCTPKVDLQDELLLVESVFT